ncbi:hypothetical protein [Accumulibacter sp.]|uniref:hypothetical protein n=1 Tax=Accumulibacter sp. TaxID=2053492 RepID=UPI0025F70AF2|nr:hypothetical protein [Accumulibacter sp.]MCM8613294.1 hypothetical protein [Accumulibacter sp.]MCM8637289.1 hypothetical protein [Accumulibacter sp.]MCM8640795.1 hypothetical protein [Accumulibacter sp.]
MEGDVDHSISLVTSRLQPDRTLLFADLQDVDGQRFPVLHPAATSRATPTHGTQKSR